MSRRSIKKELAVKQQEAEEAVIKAQIGFMDVLNLQRFAERVAEGHRRLQIDNHFGLKVFGVEK